MASYTIIGGDQKEYGPVSADEVRQWIAEGRLDEKSSIKAENETQFRRLDTFPEFAGAFAGRSPAYGTPVHFRASSAGPEGDYDLDIGNCISRAWSLVKENFGTLFASLLVMVVVSFAFFGFLGIVVSFVVPRHLMAIALFKVSFNYLLSALSAVVLGPLLGGLYLLLLKTIRGLPASIGDVLAGFQKSFLQLFLGYLAVVLVSGFCMAPFNYLEAVKLDPILAQLQNATPSTVQSLAPQIMTALSSLAPVLLICLIPMTYLSVNWIFTQSLIIDQQIDFLTAMKLSWKRVHRHWWHVFGLVVVTGLLNVAGAFLCCVGLLFTVPIGFAALMFAYETIFSERQAA